MELKKFNRARAISDSINALHITKDVMQDKSTDFKVRFIGAMKQINIPFERLDSDTIMELSQTIRDFIDKKIVELEKEFEEL